MNNHVKVDLSRYEYLITCEEQLRALIEIIYKATEYNPYEEGLRISNVKGDRILRYLDVIDGNYQKESRRLEEEYKRKQDEEYAKRANK